MTLNLSTWNFYNESLTTPAQHFQSRVQVRKRWFYNLFNICVAVYQIFPLLLPACDVWLTSGLHLRGVGEMVL